MLPWQALRFAMNWEEMKILSERCRLFVTKALKCNLLMVMEVVISDFVRTNMGHLGQKRGQSLFP